MDYQKALRIDKHDLDNEIVRQASFYHTVAQEAAVAASRRDQAKDDLKRITAERSLAIRAQLEADGEKTTEPKVEALLQRDAKRREAAAVLLGREAEVGQAEALKEAWAMRQWMLRELASLYSAGYWSTSAVGGKSERQVLDDAAEKNRKKVAERRRELRS